MPRATRGRRRPSGGTSRRDDSAWATVTVPEWRYDLEAPGRRIAASSILWYRKAFDGPPAQPGRRHFLVFAGVEWEAEVWLNGVFLGRHQWYFEPFRFDVTSLVREKNLLAVRVIAGPRFGEPICEFPLLPDVPAAEQLYVRDRAQSVRGHKIGMLYAGSGIGIHREVFLESTGLVCVAGLLVRWDAKTDRANVTLEIDSAVDGQATFDIRPFPRIFPGSRSARPLRSACPAARARKR